MKLNRFESKTGLGIMYLTCTSIHANTCASEVVGKARILLINLDSYL